jgi:hypothetical protein
VALRAGRRRRFWAVLVFFARLVEASGRVYRRASAFITEVGAATDDAVVSETGGDDGAAQGAPGLSPLTPLE